MTKVPGAPKWELVSAHEGPVIDALQGKLCITHSISTVLLIVVLKKKISIYLCAFIRMCLRVCVCIRSTAPPRYTERTRMA